eukprot:835070-Amphidinium_carterae.1
MQQKLLRAQRMNNSGGRSGCKRPPTSIYGTSHARCLGGIPYACTHDGGTFRFPDPEVKVHGA